jgi:hypothetical protein
VLIIRNGRAAGGRLLAVVITIVLTLASFQADAGLRTLDTPVAAPTPCAQCG